MIGLFFFCYFFNFLLRLRKILNKSNRSFSSDPVVSLLIFQPSFLTIVNMAKIWPITDNHDIYSKRGKITDTQSEINRMEHRTIIFQKYNATIIISAHRRFAVADKHVGKQCGCRPVQPDSSKRRYESSFEISLSVHTCGR